VDGEETEEIDSGEAPGFYYLIISENDEPVERWRIYRERPPVEYPINPAVEGGFGRILGFLAGAFEIVRGSLGL